MRTAPLLCSRRPVVAVVCTILACAAFLTCATSAMAQDLSGEEMEAFESHVAKGGNLLQQEEYEPAIAELEQARELIDHPRLSIGVANAYLDWGRCARATEEYEILLERDDLDDDQRQQVTEAVEQARNECVEMAPLNIDCTPADAVLHIDGEPADCPFDDDVAAGQRSIEVTADGFETHTETIDVVPAEITETTIALAPEEVEPPPTDWVNIASYGAMGTGAAMLVGGGLLDYRAGSRSTEIAQAQQEGDFDRIHELEQSASTARTANAILYAGGLAFVAGGLVLQFVDFGSSDTGDDNAGFAVGLGPSGISTVFRF